MSVAVRHSSSRSQRSDPGPIHCGYDALFEPELERKYICPVCLTALREPVQTKCGHRFCKACLKRSCSNMRFAKCPVDNTWFDTAKEVFVDNAVKREVLSLTVKCDQSSEGCSWKGELRDVQKHTSECPEVEVECPNECSNRKHRRRHLEDHMASCPQRLQACTHCDNMLPVADLPKHQLLVCPKFPVSCAVCGETNILREDIPRHVDLLNGDCPLVTVKCSFHNVGCYFQDKRKNMLCHYDSACHQHMVLMCARMTLHEERLWEHDKHLVEVITKSNQLWEMDEKHNRTLREHQQQLSGHMQRLKEVANIHRSGTLIWKIALPEGPVGCQLSSPSFYTGVPGYKIKLYLEVAGHTEGDRLYSSMFVSLEKGNYDDNLKFPFDGTCFITMLDQSDSVRERRNHTTEIVCSQMGRCTTEGSSENRRRGKLKFVLTEDLLSGHFVRRGCLVIQAHTEVTQFMPLPENSNIVTP